MNCLKMYLIYCGVTHTPMLCTVFYLDRAVFLAQSHSRGLPAHRRAPYPGWLLLRLEQHWSRPAITHLSHTYIHMLFSMTTSCNRHLNSHSPTQFILSSSLSPSLFPPPAHLQSVAVVCSWHNDFFIVEENVRVSFQADSWGCVHLLSLP